MARLAQTAGLTEIQQEILSTVKTFVDKEIIPHANALEHADEYPQDIVDGMKEMGLFGLTIPEEYGGLGESLLTYALVVEQIARGWMSVSGCDQHPLHRGVHARPARHRGAEGEVPAADGGRGRCAGRSRCPSRTWAPTWRRSRRGPSRTADGYRIDGAKMWLTNGGTSNLTAVLVRTDEGAPKPHQNLTCFLVEKPVGYGEVAPGPDSCPGRSTRWATRASTPPSWCSTASGSPASRSSAASAAAGSPR